MPPREIRPTGRGEAQPGRLPPCASADVGVAARRDERTFSRPGISPRPIGLPPSPFAGGANVSTAFRTYVGAGAEIVSAGDAAALSQSSDAAAVSPVADADADRQYHQKGNGDPNE